MKEQKNELNVKRFFDALATIITNRGGAIVTVKSITKKPGTDIEAKAKEKTA